MHMYKVISHQLFALNLKWLTWPLKVTCQLG